MEIQSEKSKIQAKIELIIKCAQTGEQITGQTIYQGKPVGKWLIQYRNQINRGKLEISKEILKQLRELGLLGKKIDSNIHEKIQELIDWNRKYPFAQVTNLSLDKKELRRYVKSEEEYQKLLKKYEKMQTYYIYIRTRKSQGKLTQEQEELCREGNIRGVFGYPSTTIDLSRKYGLNLEKIDSILSKYGNMENFVTAFINDKLDEEDKALLLGNLNLYIDISQQGDIRHIKFVKYFAKYLTMAENNNEIKFFDSEKIQELISRLTPKQKQIINLYFGLIDGKEITTKEIAEMFEVTVQAISSSMKKSFRKLAIYEKVNSTVFQAGEICQSKKQRKFTVQQKMKIDSILGRIYSSNLIFIPDEGFSQETNDITPEELASIAAKVKEFRMKIKQREEQKQDRQEEMRLEVQEQDTEIVTEKKGFEREIYTPLENLDLSVRAYNIFGRHGIKTLEQLRYKKEEEIFSLRGMGKMTFEEVKQKLRAIIPEGEDIFIEDTRQETEVLIDELRISDQLFNILKRANINTVADLRNLTGIELENIEGIKENGFRECIIIELKKLEKKYGRHMTELERLKHLKAEKADEDEILRTKIQEASELLDSYEQLVTERVQDNEEQR